MVKQSVDEEQVKRSSRREMPVSIGFVPSINTQDPERGKSPSKSAKENDICQQFE